jgi:hypothetical protein
MMLKNTDKIKDNFPTCLHTAHMSGSLCLPHGSKMKKNSHLKLTSKWKQNIPWCKILRMNYQKHCFLQYAKICEVWGGSIARCWTYLLQISYCAKPIHLTKTLGSWIYCNTELYSYCVTANEHSKFINNYIHP